MSRARRPAPPLPFARPLALPFPLAALLLLLALAACGERPEGSRGAYVGGSGGINLSR